MSDTISLNCLIVPFGPLRGLPLDRATIDRDQTVSALEAIIQRRLGTPFDNNRLKIHQVQPNETLMQPQDTISSFFTAQPRDDYCHIVVHPLTE